MTDFPITTALISADLAIGWQTALGLTTELSPIEESASIVRSWNGRARNLAAPEFQLFHARSRPVRICGHRRFPACGLGRLYACSPSELSDVIQQGATSRTLIRNPHPGSVRCLTKNFVAMPFTVSGRVLTLSTAATEPVRIFTDRF